MKKIGVLFLSMAVLFGCSDRPSNEIAKESNFHLSEIETSCAFIFYDVPDSPPLKLDNRVLNHPFDEENILTTSSTYDFGWKNKDTGGFKTFNYYNADGSKVEAGQEPFYSNGTISIDGKEYQHALLKFDENKNCFSEDDYEDYRLTTDLIRKVYNVKNT